MSIENSFPHRQESGFAHFPLGAVCLDPSFFLPRVEPSGDTHVVKAILYYGEIWPFEQLAQQSGRCIDYLNYNVKNMWYALSKYVIRVVKSGQTFSQHNVH